ncbi:wax ester/triacylglycerol synthase family O-acyltransferase [Antrihabitans sp. YC2-6]|uniref:WS/DGAT/MGAT family O-acyltransferase n=1 Tax=Antrihabitans sp. YC2-6 TaxID=2799498 RepID=UPI0018F5A9BA|nr:wax ester/triacylglycerol synthase family O-acyltransferase [Antrihabitans sp. YC2-6]MBJ8345090.1 wax ester/triacylglycerol synthase family O-acyltransferase [Antrihabitans sp. YC2-6]
MERLSGLDASFLYMETPTQLLNVCGLIELDASTIPGGYSFDALKQELGQRTRLIPAFRRKLHDSALNLDHPVWIDDTDFDIDRHCHRVSVHAPGDREALAEMCGHIASQPLDRSRPLWEMWVVEGLADGRIAIMTKMHHAGVDGATGASVMSQLCSLEPDAPAPDPSTARETGGASTLELAVGGLLGVAARPFQLAKLLPGAVPVLPQWISRARRGDAMPAPFTAPRTSFNGTITGHRSIAYAQLDLSEVKTVKKAFDAKVNDVVLTLVASALRMYLEDRGELPESSLVAVVPVSVHAKSNRPGTNKVSSMFSQLRTDIDDPAERLTAIAEANVIAKLHQQAIDANMLQDWSQFAGPATFGVAMRLYSKLRLADRHPVIHNLVVSNVPGPPMPLYFLGARVTAMYPLGPVFHGAGLTVTVLSLENQLNVGLIACSELVPNLWSLADAFPEALEELLSAARAKSPKRKPAKAQT